MLFEIGTICIKLAGRDAGKKCVVVDVIDDVYVLIDGQTRRRKCNVAHLEPLKSKLNIKKGTDTAAVTKAFDAIGVTVVATKPKKAASRPLKPRALPQQKKKTEKKVSKK